MSSSESEFYMVVSLGCDVPGLKLAGSTSFQIRIRDELFIGAGGRDGMGSSVCRFHEPSLL